MSDNSSMQTHKPTGSMATRRSKVMLFLKGVAMGLGDSVPGISGGTIAVITKIYDQLVFSLPVNSRRSGSISTERSCLSSLWEFCAAC
jgi:uncharacterized membrane protein